MNSKTKSCPKCKSKQIRFVDYLGIRCIVCTKCGYDERDIYEDELGEKTSQKARGRYTPYKTGGSRRSQKISK